MANPETIIEDLQEQDRLAYEIGQRQQQIEQRQQLRQAEAKEAARMKAERKIAKEAARIDPIFKEAAQYNRELSDRAEGLITTSQNASPEHRPTDISPWIKLSGAEDTEQQLHSIFGLVQRIKPYDSRYRYQYELKVVKFSPHSAEIVSERPNYWYSPYISDVLKPTSKYTNDGIHVLRPEALLTKPETTYPILRNNPNNDYILRKARGISVRKANPLSGLVKNIMLSKMETRLADISETMKWLEASIVDPELNPQLAETPYVQELQQRLQGEEK